MSTSIQSKSPLSKQERNRKIKAIYREMEAKKRELGLKAPLIKRGPVFYLVVLVVLALVGGLVIQTAGKGGGKKMRDGDIVRAEHSTAANSPKSIVVAIELSQTRRICCRKTNIEKYGNSPIMIRAARSIR